MVKCLYKKYTLKKGIPYQERHLIQVMRSVGQLALRTLLSNNPVLEKSEVLRIAGDFVLDYGFLAGHRDFSDPTADISVTYAHRSIEEFFGSFAFLQALAEGQSLDDILGSDCKKPIFMVNPLVLRFCLWFQTKECFNFSRDIYQKLVLFAAERIDFRLLDTRLVEEMYPAMNINHPLRETYSLELNFLEHVLEKCHYVRVLIISNGEDNMCNYEQVDGVLGLMSSDLLSKLTCLLITGEYPHSSVHQDPLAISIDPTDPDTLHKCLNIVLPKYKLLKRNPQVYARVEFHESQDLSTLMTKHIKHLYLSEKGYERQFTLLVSGEFPHCPQLTHFTLEFIQIDNSVATAFLKAVQNGELPYLKRVELFCCIVNDCEWPVVPEFSFGTDKMIDLSQMQKLLSKVTELTVCRPPDTGLVILYV